MGPGDERVHFQTCDCGRVFFHLHVFTVHQKTCSKSKKRLTSALSRAREACQEQKRRQLDSVASHAAASSLVNRENNTELPVDSDLTTVCVTIIVCMLEMLRHWILIFDTLKRMTEVHVIGSSSVLTTDVAETMSLAERRPRRRRQLPVRFRDILPEPAPSLPPNSGPTPSLAPQIGTQPQSGCDSPGALTGAASTWSSASSIPNHIVPSICPCDRHVLRSPPNSFNLIRQYYHAFPDHDPEDNTSLEDLSSQTLPSDSRGFYPYPNENSFRLGEWYWNQNTQKSQNDFKTLLSIVSDSGFHPSRVRNTKWDDINRKLGLNEFDKQEWIDEDAGWMKKHITISVPFHSKTASPGPREYVVDDFYHRSLVSVMREKLQNRQDNRLFHYQPYELFWQPADGSQRDVRVYGELYTSPVFIEAHNDLQNSPREPGCELPCVVVGLMFWSDSTHLASFGNTKLWPLYCFFGNESKYRRCKPSSNLCCHMAYFKTVSTFTP